MSGTIARFYLCPLSDTPQRAKFTEFYSLHHSDLIRLASHAAVLCMTLLWPIPPFTEIIRKCLLTMGVVPTLLGWNTSWVAYFSLMPFPLRMATLFLHRILSLPDLFASLALGHKWHVFTTPFKGTVRIESWGYYYCLDCCVRKSVFDGRNMRLAHLAWEK